jgi:hypothetical protein
MYTKQRSDDLTHFINASKNGTLNIWGLLLAHFKNSRAKCGQNQNRIKNMKNAFNKLVLSFNWVRLSSCQNHALYLIVFCDSCDALNSVCSCSYCSRCFTPFVSLETSVLDNFCVYILYAHALVPNTHCDNILCPRYSLCRSFVPDILFGGMLGVDILSAQRSLCQCSMCPIFFVL